MNKKLALRRARLARGAKRGATVPSRTAVHLALRAVLPGRAACKGLHRGLDAEGDICHINASSHLVIAGPSSRDTLVKLGRQCAERAGRRGQASWTGRRSAALSSRRGRGWMTGLSPVPVERRCLPCRAVGALPGPAPACGCTHGSCPAGARPSRACHPPAGEQHRLRLHRAVGHTRN